MNAAQSAREAQERLARFNQRPEIQGVSIRYADWARSSDGIFIGVNLAVFALMRLNGQMTECEYRDSIHQLGSGSKLPAQDFTLIAECQFEQTRYLLGGSGCFSVDEAERPFPRPWP